MTDVLMRNDHVEKIKKLADLKDQGILTEEEFASEKKKVFNEKSKEEEKNIDEVQSIIETTSGYIVNPITKTILLTLIIFTISFTYSDFTYEGTSAFERDLETGIVGYFIFGIFIYNSLYFFLEHGYLHLYGRFNLYFSILVSKENILIYVISTLNIFLLSYIFF